MKDNEKIKGFLISFEEAYYKQRKEIKELGRIIKNCKKRNDLILSLGKKIINELK